MVVMGPNRLTTFWLINILPDYLLIYLLYLHFLNDSLSNVPPIGFGGLCVWSFFVMHNLVSLRDGEERELVVLHLDKE